MLLGGDCAADGLRATAAAASVGCSALCGTTGTLELVLLILRFFATATEESVSSWAGLCGCLLPGLAAAGGGGSRGALSLAAGCVTPARKGFQTGRCCD